MNQNKKSFQMSSDNPNANTILSTIVFLILIGIGAWYFYGGGLEQETETTLQEISDKVAEYSVAEYNMASLSGDTISICVQAGMVSAAYLQAQNQTQYLIWKEIEKVDCERAGL